MLQLFRSTLKTSCPPYVRLSSSAATFTGSSDSEIASEPTATATDTDIESLPVSRKWAATRRLLQLYAPEKKPLAISLAALSVSAAVTMTVPFGMGHIVDMVATTATTTTATATAATTTTSLPVIASALSAVFAAGFAANVIHDSIHLMIGERISCRLRDATFQSLLKQELGFFDASRTGDLLSRLSADTTVVGKTLSDNVSNGFHDLALTLGGTAMLFLTSPKLACVMLGVVPPVAIGAVYYGDLLDELTEKVQKRLSDATVVAEEKLAHIRVVRWFGAEAREIQRYAEKTNAVLSLARKRSLADATFTGGVDLSVKMGMLAVLGYGGQMVADGLLTSGELTSFLMYTLYVGFSFAGLSSFYSDLMKGIGASSRIFELLAREPQIRSLAQWSSLPSQITGRIQFEDVRFRYPTRPDSQIFRGLNLEVKPNETIALVGPSGCGKSSVIGLLARFYELDGDGCGGRILLDGVDIATLNTSELRGIIGAVSQEPPLFACSIRDNIAYGCQHENVSMDEIVEAAKAANAHDFITSFPDGYDTVVGERGQALSGGQKQRVAIARALIKKPKLLILDEATSALDPESESLVQSAVESAKKDRTVVLVAHRLSTIKSADRIAVILDGQVAELGTFDELSANPESVFSQVVLHGQN